MKSTTTHYFSSIAKQAGVMPTYWSAINLNSDRTPEGICQGSMEDRVK